MNINEIEVETTNVEPKKPRARQGRKPQNKPKPGESQRAARQLAREITHTGVYGTPVTVDSTQMDKLLYLYNLPQIDLDDSEAIKQRIQDYFAWTISAEVKPSFASLALAIGVDRKTLLSWENEETRKGSGYSDIIKKAKSLITSIVEDNGTEGRVNPVYTMFLLNSSAQGYSNNSKVEITSTAPAEQISAPSMDDIIDIYSDAGDTADPD